MATHSCPPPKGCRLDSHSGIRSSTDVSQYLVATTRVSSSKNNDLAIDLSSSEVGKGTPWQWIEKVDEIVEKNPQRREEQGKTHGIRRLVVCGRGVSFEKRGKGAHRRGRNRRRLVVQRSGMVEEEQRKGGLAASSRPTHLFRRPGHPRPPPTCFTQRSTPNKPYEDDGSQSQ